MEGGDSSPPPMDGGWRWREVVTVFGSHMHSTAQEEGFDLLDPSSCAFLELALWRTSKTDIYAAYWVWCKDLGRKPLSSIALAKIMKTLFGETREGSVRYWEGIRLKPEEADDYPDTGGFTFRVGEEGQ